MPRLRTSAALVLALAVGALAQAPDPAAAARAHRQLADLYRARGDLPAAEVAARSAVALAQRDLGEVDPRTAEARICLAEVLEAAGRLGGAAEAYHEAVGTRRAFFLKDGWNPGARARQAGVLRDYASVMERLDQPEEAAALRARAKEHERVADQAFKASLEQELATSSGVTGPTSARRRHRISIVVNGEEFRDIDDFAESRRGR